MPGRRPRWSRATVPVLILAALAGLVLASTWIFSVPQPVVLSCLVVLLSTAVAVGMSAYSHGRRRGGSAWRAATGAVGSAVRWLFFWL